MTEIKQLTRDGKTATIYETESGFFLVSYVHDGLFLDAGYFTTVDVAEDRANTLMNADRISGDMLEGNVAP